MANRQQLRRLKQEGVEAWNQWRRQNPEVAINLRGANLKGLVLRGANLRGADIRGTNFAQSDLTQANLTQAKAGLQKRWAISLTLLAWVGAAFFGAFSGVAPGVVSWIFSSSLDEVVAGWVTLSGLIFLYILLLRKGFNAFAGAGAFAGAVVLTSINVYVGWRALKGDKKYEVIRAMAVACAAFGGTNFRGANLTDAVFYGVQLKNTDFRHAIATRTHWHQTQKLDLARCGGTILDIPAIRDLAVTHDGRGKSYVGQNLKGISLSGADLSDANLTEADLSDATLENAILERANLTKVQALRTQFRQANLTAACLEAWNIDSTPQLDGVICDHAYLLNGQQERRPNSGNFAPGEFTKLFQEVLDTIDLIFRDGVDWKAFVSTFRDIQVQNDDSDLAIQSIENKGDGVVVVKVKASPETDKAKIHAEFSEIYQVKLQALEAQYRAKLEAKDSEITSYRRENANMMEITKLLASKPITVDAKSETTEYKQINYGGNNFQSDISGGQVNQGETVSINDTEDEP